MEMVFYVRNRLLVPACRTAHQGILADGTLINRQHRTRVDALVNSAINAGAVALAGGGPAEDGDLANGAFYQPAVLAEVTDDNPAAQ